MRTKPYVDLGPYFTVPKAVIRGGFAAKMSASAFAVYVALCEQLNRGSTETFRLSDKALAARTGVAERTISDIRKKLAELKLVESLGRPGASFEYRIVPQPYSGPDRTPPRTKQRPRALNAKNELPRHDPQTKNSPAKFAAPSQQNLLNPSANFADPSRGFRPGEEVSGEILEELLKLKW